MSKVLEDYSEIFDWVFETLHNETQNVDLDAFNEQELYGPLEEESRDFIELKCPVEVDIVQQNDSVPIDKEVYEKTTQTEEHLDNNQADIMPFFDTKKVSEKRPRGRPRKYTSKPKRKTVGQLWQFLLEMLNNRETNPSLVSWVCRRKGIFKLTQSEKVAKIWGEKRTNPKMNYKKMSRTIRHYYKKDIMIPVYGKKLVYQFGPNVITCLINSSN